MSNPKSQMYQYKEAYVLRDYPEAVQYADQQLSVFWPWWEVSVEKDVQDMRTNMTPAEYHGIITTLKLFVKYEIHVGVDHWVKNVMLRFPRPEIQRMASCFSMFETNVHSPFYNQINEALLIDTDEFYMSYLEDPVLKERADFIGRYMNSDPNRSVADDLVSLGVFSMIEGAVLYSSFAFLKHFQTNGKNKLLNVVRGIDFSLRDENIHSEGGAWLFRTLLKEALDCGDITEAESDDVMLKLRAAGREIELHESRIIDMIYDHGDIVGLKKADMKTFVQSRVDLCLQNITVDPIFNVIDNPIAKWFYANINSVSLNDFFSGIGNSYNRSWNETAFTWKTNN